mgnify:CR=1 FL=1
MTLPVDPGFRTDPLDPFEDLPVGLHNTPQILTETVLVEDPLLDIAHGDIPKPAGVRADLIGHHQLAGGGEAQLDLEIHQLQADAGDFDMPAKWTIGEVAQSMPETDQSATDFVLDGDLPLVYSWNVTCGAVVALANNNANSPTFVPSVGGVHEARQWVRDAKLAPAATTASVAFPVNWRPTATILPYVVITSTAGTSEMSRT